MVKVREVHYKFQNVHMFFCITCISRLTHGDQFSFVCLSLCLSVYPAHFLCQLSSAGDSYVPWKPLSEELCNYYVYTVVNVTSALYCYTGV